MLLLNNKDCKIMKLDDKTLEKTTQDILSNIAQSINTQDTKSWGAVLEVIRNELMKNNGKLAKRLIYFNLLGSYIYLWIILSALPFLIIIFYQIYKYY